MEYLKTYTKLFESKEYSIDDYLSKLDTTRQEILDIFQGIIDLGFKPQFNLVYLDKEGISSEKKSRAEETPLLTISFVTDRELHVGRSIKFNNLDYIENLYHNLYMFMSMFKDKCDIEYELDYKIELKLKLKFETEYDENKVSISRNELSDALSDCLSIVPQGYTTHIDTNHLFTSHKSITLKVKPGNEVGQRLLDELKASKTAKVVSNYDETEKLGFDIIQKLSKDLSKKLKKDIRYVVMKGSLSYKETGLYLFNGDKRDQMIAGVRITNWANTKEYGADIKRGFLKVDKCKIELETLEIDITLK